MTRLSQTPKCTGFLHGCAVITLPILLAVIFFALCAESFSTQAPSTPPFFKASFDCSKPKELSIEEAICKNEDLARLDRETSDAYRKRLDSANDSEREVVVASQREWLIVRNAHNVNPYHGDPSGELADLSDFYKARIAALQSTDPTLLKTKIPEEYAWLRAIAADGFSKKFLIGRSYAGCEDPCQKKPSLYRWISIGGSGIGEEPGDVDTPYAQVTRKLSSAGWTKCRSADDSGTPTIDYFTKGNKIVVVSRHYSMGAGNGIGLGITISGPLLPNPPKTSPNPIAIVSDDWITYSNSEVGLQVRYPPHWHVRDDSPSNGRTQYKYLLFGADNFAPGEFRITVEPRHSGDLVSSSEEEGRTCFPSRYRISGSSATECVLENEVVSEGICERYVQAVAIRTAKYDLTFEPSAGGSLAVDSGHYRLLDLYEKIMGTMEIEQSK